MVTKKFVSIDVHGLDNFLQKYSGMSIAPSRSEDLVLKGEFSFIAQYEGLVIEDSYSLRIEVPKSFPKRRPQVKELHNKIPNDGQHHLNPDGTLCLGSPLQVLIRIKSKPDLCGFVEECLIPFLYAISKKRSDGLPFFMGELQHGVPGIIEDYRMLFKVKSEEQVMSVLRLISQKRRYANKQPCVCGCGKRLGVCPTRIMINQMRHVQPRSWFRFHIETLGSRT